MHLCWVKAQRWPCRSQGCFPLEPESFSHPTHRRRERRASQASCTRQPCSAPAASGPGLALGAGKRNQFSRPDGSADTYPSVPFFHSVLQLLRGFLRNVNNRLLWLEVICTRQGEKAEIDLVFPPVSLHLFKTWSQIETRFSRYFNVEHHLSKQGCPWLRGGLKMPLLSLETLLFVYHLYHWPWPQKELFT